MNPPIFQSYQILPTTFRWAPSVTLAFLLLSAIRFIAALVSPIADCDEIFNYWEPMHYLLFGHGFQTWEYSPEFALRSYAYLYPYALIAKISMLFYPHLHSFSNAIPLLPPKIFAFYAVRVLQGILCAAAETYLYFSVTQRFGSSIAISFLFFLVFSPGIFRSAVEFLPSSFAMISLSVAFAAWMTNRFFLAVFFVALASLLGWVFTAILAVPMALHIIIRPNGVLSFAKYSVVSAILILIFMIPIDTYHFGKIVVAPVNHILYNVFPKEGAGSHIYGVDSWKFYVINLFLNCNVAFLLYASFPILLIIASFCFPIWGRSGMQLWERLIFLSPSYIAIAIFFCQPHKEERFLAPCYPFISLVAAVTFTDWLSLFSRMLRASLSHRIRSTFIVLFAIMMALVYALLGISRITMQVKSFGAPFNIFQTLSISELQNGVGPRNGPLEYISTNRQVNICVGKEWYRFPSSFFLPGHRFRLQFIMSGFNGLLPKPFSEDGFGTRHTSRGLNEFNKQDPQQFYDWKTKEGCHYFVDLDLIHRNSNSSGETGQQNPIPGELYKVVSSQLFLDSEESPPGFRAFYVPWFDEKLVHGEYRLIRNSQLLPDGCQGQMKNSRIKPSADTAQKICNS